MTRQDDGIPAAFNLYTVPISSASRHLSSVIRHLSSAMLPSAMLPCCHAAFRTPQGCGLLIFLEASRQAP